jgi:hypothetical protein
MSVIGTVVPIRGGGGGFVARLDIVVPLWADTRAGVGLERMIAVTLVDSGGVIAFTAGIAGLALRSCRGTGRSRFDEQVSVLPLVDMIVKIASSSADENDLNECMLNSEKRIFFGDRVSLGLLATILGLLESASLEENVQCCNASWSWLPDSSRRFAVDAPEGSVLVDIVHKEDKVLCAWLAMCICSRLTGREEEVSSLSSSSSPSDGLSLVGPVVVDDSDVDDSDRYVSNGCFFVAGLLDLLW